MILLASLLSRFEMPFLRNFFEKLRTVYKLFTIRAFLVVSHPSLLSRLKIPILAKSIKNIMIDYS